MQRIDSGGVLSDCFVDLLTINACFEMPQGSPEVILDVYMIN